MEEAELSYQEIITKFQGKNILVIGDFILDVYLQGVSTRLSGEAPVPVVDITESKRILGGSGNIVANLRALGANVSYCTVVGSDHEGEEALLALEHHGVKRTSIVRAVDRKTITKTRVISGNQVITRFDQGEGSPIDEYSEDLLIQFITQNYEACDAVVISDYQKGTVTDKILSALVRLQARWPKFMAVQSGRLHYFHKLHPYLAKTNYDDCARLVDIPYQTDNRCTQIASIGPELYQQVNAEIIAVTLEKEGSLILEMGQPVHRSTDPMADVHNNPSREDTYFTAFMLSYLTCINCAKSAEIANAALRIADKKDFTYLCTNGDLRSHFNVQNKLIASPDQLAVLSNEYHTRGKRIVFTDGAFDILHSGHVTFLHCAKELGDVLIVAVRNDESTKRLKGSDKPKNPVNERLRVLSGLTSVDHVVTFGSEVDDTVMPIINILKPHIFTKGGEFPKEDLPEARFVEECGGQVVFLPYIPDHSTTSIINKIDGDTLSDHALLSKLQ